jgi:hypothetical protein
MSAQAVEATQKPFRLPAFTAYAHPDPGAMSRSRNGNLRQWSGRVHWHIYCTNPGALQVRLVPLAGQTACSLELTGLGAAQTFAFTGEPLDAAFAVTQPGYVELSLRCTKGTEPGLEAIEFSGPAALGMRASTVERRNCASVHLSYEVPKAAQSDIEWFYCEVTPRTDPLWTYYMATGWDRGYFGMQVNSPTERRVIFSVWDSGNEAVDRAKVKADDLVQLAAKGDQVVIEGFGNEGTGGHSHRVTPWTLGGSFGFLVHAAVDGTHTTYTGWFRSPDSKDWELIASFRAPKDGRLLHGLYSFDENFAGENGDALRDCEFGKQWVRTKAGDWIELTKAQFTHDGHGKSLRLDRSGGVVDNGFYLRSGGFSVDPRDHAATKYGDRIERAASAALPATLKSLPTPPPAPTSHKQ